MTPGSTFGDYTVVRKLGRGGMGEVWLLEGKSGRQVAAKILEATADHEARKRFLREAQLALGVKHPNLVETYDVGEDPETGLCYILMEYVSGGTLADYIKAHGPLAIEDAVAVVRAISDVLELGRQKGIVHRDIKPANIMFDAERTPKLADLGIARAENAGTETTTVTQTGAIIGTPAYMSPEQMLDSHNVDTRADIYSLGVVFFEMLTGQRPNKDDTIVQLMAKAVKGEPLPDVRTLRPEVSASLAQLLNMMVAPNKDGRISTPGQITNALAIIERGGELGDAMSSSRRNKGESIRFRRGEGAASTGSGSGGSPSKWLIPVAALAALAVAYVVLMPKRERATRPDTQNVARAEIRTNAVNRAVERTDDIVQAVVGCDVSTHGRNNFYCVGMDNRAALRFGSETRFVPLQFRLDQKVLDRVNVLVLSGAFGEYESDEQRAILSFADQGGVVLALVYATNVKPNSKAIGSAPRWLNSLGVSVYNTGKDAYLNVILTGEAESSDGFSDSKCGTYLSCSPKWKPLAVGRDEPRKIVCAILQIGSGFIIVAPEDYATTPRDRKAKFPWERILGPRLKPPRRSDTSFAGSTLDDAPYEARSSRMRFVSSYVPSDNLRWIAEMDDAAARLIVHHFGHDALPKSAMRNCIVGSWSGYIPYVWRNRLKSLDAIELRVYAQAPPEQYRPNSFAVVQYLKSCILGQSANMGAECSISSYMAEVVYDDLCRNGFTFKGMWLPQGASNAIAVARQIDPSFTLYDEHGKPKSAKTRTLSHRDEWIYAKGRFFAMVEDLRRKRPDVVIRCLRQERDCPEPIPNYSMVIDALCEAYGNDLPRFWPSENRQPNVDAGGKKIQYIDDKGACEDTSAKTTQATAGEDAKRSGKRVDAAKLKDEDPTRAVQKTLDALFPGWKTSEVGNSGRLGYWEERDGERDVLCTHPLRRGVPLTLSKTVAVSGREPMLHVKLANNERGRSFRLRVRINGQNVREKEITDGWTDVYVALRKWKDKKAKVELDHMPTGWCAEWAFWSAIEIVDDQNLVELERVQSAEPVVKLFDHEKIEGSNPKRAVQRTCDVLFPRWKVSENGHLDEAGYEEEFSGRYNLLLTHPPREGVPVVLLRNMKLPVGKPKLYISIANQPDGDFELQVKVNDKIIARPDISGEGWKDLTFDLSAWAGRPVKLELLQMPTGWHQEWAHWQRVEVK